MYSPGKAPAITGPHYILTLGYGEDTLIEVPQRNSGHGLDAGVDSKANWPHNEPCTAISTPCICNRMKSIAIVGAGIAGLGCAYLLNRHYNITLFDGNAHAGGHSNTVCVDEEGQSIPIDTGFMVYNHQTYPGLTKLFQDLGVDTFATDMSFSMHHKPRRIEWCGSSLNQVFGQRKNIFNPSFWRFVLELDRFNKQAEEDYSAQWIADIDIFEYCRKRGFGQDLLDLYLLPMGSAIWSTPPDTMRKFPAATLLRFFHNHRFNSGLNGHLQWFTIKGGSREYVKRMIGPLADRVRLATPVQAVRTVSNGVELQVQGQPLFYDLAIVATHADEALKLLEHPGELEQQLLGKFSYSRSSTWLHTDSIVMPESRRCWASWNYKLEEINEQLVPTTHYWMNNLQQVSRKRDYFVSLNADHLVDRATVLKELSYTHPTFTNETRNAQSDLHLLNAPDRSIRFCGSYFGYGFHEDAYRSALELCSPLLSGEPACIK